MTRHPIEDLVHRYSDAVVRRDRDTWAAAWDTVATWDLGSGRAAIGRDAIVEMWGGAMARYAAVVQTVLNGTFEVDEATGTGQGRWYVLEILAPTEGAPQMMLGHYDDDYVLTGDGWRFGARRLTQHYRGSLPADGRFPTIDDA